MARAELIDAELALDDDPERAQAGAEAVVAHSIQRGERRYATLGRLLAARGRHRADPQAPVDLDGLAVDLDRLASVAGLDSWWLTAQVAAEFDQDRWWTLARHRAADLAAQTGDRADSFRSSAQMGLDRLAVRRRGR